MIAIITNTNNRIDIEHNQCTLKEMAKRVKKELEYFTKQHVIITIDGIQYSRQKFINDEVG